MEKNKTPFEILVFVDNAPRHALLIGDLYLNVKVVFLPPNTTSLILPRSHRFIADVKACYLRKSFAKLLLQAKEPLRRH